MPKYGIDKMISIFENGYKDQVRDQKGSFARRNRKSTVLFSTSSASPSELNMDSSELNMDPKCEKKVLNMNNVCMGLKQINFIRSPLRETADKLRAELEEVCWHPCDGSNFVEIASHFLKFSFRVSKNPSRTYTMEIMAIVKKWDRSPSLLSAKWLVCV